MARRSKKSDAALITLFLIGIPIVLIVNFVQAVGAIPIVVLILLVIALYMWNKSSQRKKRLAYLNSKYADPDIVEKIINKYIWQGQTAEQLIDSIGKPVAVDDKVLKTKKREIWKYDHQGANRYGTRVTLENDEVVGWESKS